MAKSTGSLMCPGLCGRKRRTGELLCKPCWRSLPAGIRGEVYKNWRFAYAHLSDKVAWSHYLQARRVALHHLRSRTRVSS